MNGYALVSPVRNEADNLRRLLACVERQTVRPLAWAIVDNGSTDETTTVAAEAAARHSWVTVLSVPGEERALPGAPIVRAFNAGLDAVGGDWELVVKLDADVSFDDDYFERVLAAFAADERLGIASGACYELEEGEWRVTHVTAGHVRGAARTYRHACFAEIAPLVERVGWDGIDELKATVRGWRTSVLPDIPFYHHRSVGARDGGRHRRAAAQGRAAYYMGYRFGYLCVRALFYARKDPARLAMIGAYLQAALRREERHDDAEVRSYLRKHQSVRALPLRVREALGRRSA